MELIRNNWSKKDIKNFEQYLESLKVSEKILWTKNALNTNTPVLAIPTKTLRTIAKKICKGNKFEFLDLQIFSTHESTMIYAIILNTINEFEIYKKYLELYKSHSQSWATCDILKPNIKHQEKNFFNLAKSYLTSNQPFVKRIGIIIFFPFIPSTNYLTDIFNILKGLKNETEYYVNMAVAWFICECYIKQKNLALNFLQNNNINIFTLNKTIQKCKESFRISDEDKKYLTTLIVKLK